MELIRKNPLFLILVVIIIIIVFILVLNIKEIKKERDLRNYIITAESFINKGNIDLAIEYYDKALDIDPDNYFFYFEVGEIIFANSANPNDAEKYFKKSFDLSSENEYRIHSFNYLLNIYIKREDYDSMIKTSSDFIDKTDNNYFIGYAHLMISNAYIFMGEKEEAKFHLSEAKNKKIESFYSEDLIGRDFDFHFDFYFENSIVVSDFYYGLYFERNYDELIEKIENSNLDNQKYFLLAKAYFQKEDYDDAIYFLNEFEKKQQDILDYEKGDFLLMNAVSFLQKNDCQKAKIYFKNLNEFLSSLIIDKEESLRFSGSYASFLGLGECEIRNENYDKALEYVLEGISLTKNPRLNQYQCRILLYQSSIMLNYKAAEIYLLKNKSEESVRFLKEIEEIKKEVPLNIWEIINDSYWPKDNDVSLEEKIKLLRQAVETR